jgi:polyisoprenyl-phosphate glycosyltransferase
MTLEAGAVPPSRFVSIVVPTYKSEASITELTERIIAVFAVRSERFEIILVNDASPDSTWVHLKKLHATYPKIVRIVKLLKNSGQHNAILCGLHYVRGDIAVTMDDDLQHPPEEIPKLLALIDEGADLVIAAFEGKQHARYRNIAGSVVDTVIRYIYRLPNSMQLTSFRAINRSVIDVARRSQNAYPYVTCILLDQASNVRNVTVRHDVRPYGHSSYSPMRSLLLAANLLFSYSSAPLYIAAVSSGIAGLFSAGFLVWVAIRVLTTPSGVPGWASVMVAIAFFSSLILTSLFVIGIYVARIHHQMSGRRVPFTVDENHG